MRACFSPRWHALLFRTLFVLFLQTVLFAGASPAASSGSVPYLEVNLKNWIDVSNARPGHTFSATALNPWTGPGCTLRTGARVYGHIVAATKGAKAVSSSSLALVIDAADCGTQKKVPLPMIVVEVIGHLETDNYQQNDLPGSPMNNTDQLGSMGDDIRRQGANVKADLASVQPGTVQNLSDVSLELGSGPDGSSLLTGARQSLRFIPGTRLILAPSSDAPALIKMQGAR